MESEDKANNNESDVQDKQEHIKERLKEMGVASDSVRPEKSWLSKYGNYLMLTVIAVLVAAYWYESNKDLDGATAEQTAYEGNNNADVNPNFEYANDVPLAQQQIMQQAAQAEWQQPSPMTHQNSADPSVDVPNEQQPNNYQANRQQNMQPSYPPNYWQNNPYNSHPYWSGYMPGYMPAYRTYREMAPPVMNNNYYQNQPRQYVGQNQNPYAGQQRDYRAQGWQQRQQPSQQYYNGWQQ